MDERRHHPRLAALKGASAAIETRNMRYIGVLSDISARGVGLEIRSRVGAESMTVTPLPASLEFMAGDDCWRFKGKIVHRGRARIGFHADSMFPREIIDRIAEDHQSMVRMTPLGIVVSGKLTIRLNKELIRFLTRGVTVDLSRVTDIDSVGLAMAHRIQADGGKLRHCAPEIRTYMRIAKVCMACDEPTCPNRAAHPFPSRPPAGKNIHNTLAT